MSRKENPMLITFSELPAEERWKACVNALEFEYTLTFKDICKTLKCSRSWANRYVKPHLHYIYLANGSGKSANFLMAASKILKKKMTETTWYSKEEFETLIRKYIKSVTRQTILVPIEKMIKSEHLNEFLKDFVSKEEVNKALECGDEKEYKRLMVLRNLSIEKYGTSIGKTMWQDAPSPYKRKGTPSIHTNIDVTTIDLETLQAVHDLKDYGDTDEEIYRDLFSNAYHKILIELPDADGVLSQKIFYWQEKNDISTTIETILVKYKYVSKDYNI